jgi:pyruvate dehydrogenase E2 component (dihydrolipoamide acetyltransferase)
MAVEIVMPHLSDSMEEGTVVHWFVSAGDTVAEGDPLLEVETDKATVTYEAEQDGTVLSLTAQEGESIAVGAVIAVIGAPGEAVPVASPGAQAVAEAAANAGDGAGDGDGAASALATTATVASPPVGVPAAGSTGRRVKASPLARRVAAEFGVDLASLVGSGPHGRVIRSDVERSVAASPATGGKLPMPPTPAAAAATEASGPPSADGARGATTRTSLSRLQQTIARRMAQSRATVPDFELRCEVDMTATVALRAQIRDVADPPPSYNDFIVKAAATALREFPRVNSAYRDEMFEHYERVNVGIAVAAEDALVVPTIFDADVRSLSQIAAAARELAGKVRDGSISPAELAGGTFSVSNLGMHGIDSFTAVVNAPQAAILAVGSLKQRPIVDEAGAIVARPTLQLTLACDHRILYGADGARFLGRIRDLLQAPVGMLI